MKADPADQLRLLDLQAVDTALDQLAHRQSHLPEHTQVRDLEEQLRTVSADVIRAETEVGDLDRAQQKLEADVEQVRTRAARDQQRMQSGTSAKEVESLQHEVASLARRQSDLEDQLLDLMEQREEAAGQQAAAERRRGEVRTALDDAVQRRDAALAEMAASGESRGQERAGIAAEIPADLLALYEKIRASSGGTGAARLFRRRCEGCHLELSGSDHGAVKAAAPEEVVRCEECRRILVRTAESGL